jgi:hypothetical protein
MVLDRCASEPSSGASSAVSGFSGARYFAPLSDRGIGDGFGGVRVQLGPAFLLAPGFHVGCGVVRRFSVLRFRVTVDDIGNGFVIGVL